MAQFRISIAQRATGGLPRDDVVNTFYVDTDIDPLTWSSDPGGLLRDAVDLWRSEDLPLSDQAQWISGKAYNMSDAEPRQPVAEVSWLTANAQRPASGPRELAVCLSYYAGRNLPRLRGRMYMGPWAATAAGLQVPAGITAGLTGLAEGLSGLGGPNVQWVQHSQVTGNYTNVSDYFVDNEWDHVQRRGQKATARAVGTVSG